jgi:hypothetical protein
LVVTARPTVPVNPPRGATVVVDVAVAPELLVTLVGVATIVKSCTMTVIFVELVFAPLTPVTVTV